MQTCRADRKEFVTLPRKQHGILVDVSEEHLPSSDIATETPFVSRDREGLAAALPLGFSGVSRQFCAYFGVYDLYQAVRDRD